MDLQDQADFDQAHEKYEALAQRSEILDALESFAKVVGPLALEAGVAFAPGGSAASTVLRLASKGIPLLEAAGKL